MIFNPHESPEEAELFMKCKGVEEYWADKMPMMTMEECAELIQAISKYERHMSQDNYNNMIKEMADVYISLEALIFYYSAGNEDVAEKINGDIINAILTKLNKKY